MFDLEEQNPAPSYWPSVTDLFMTLFIISIAILAVVFFALLPKNNLVSERAIILAVGLDMVKIREPLNGLRGILELPLIRPTQKPTEVMTALEETCDKAIQRIKALELDIIKLSNLDDAREELSRLQNENRDLKTRLQNLENLIESLKKELRDLYGRDIEEIIAENFILRRQLNDQPPNIQFSEQREDYRFGSGSSTMDEKFVEGLRKNEFKQLAEEIIARQEMGRVKVDTLEIIGHTDGVPFSGRSGNLDQFLPDALVGVRQISTLIPGSNNDLGLLRALAVREQWEKFISEHENEDILRKIEVRCYSAGQTIIPSPQGELEAQDYRQNDPRARRIEMRLTRLNREKEEPNSNP